MRLTRRAGSAAAVAGAVVVAVAAWAGVAVAVSSGGYSPGDNGCPVYPDANTFTGAYPDCHNYQVLVTDGAGHTYLELGTDQTPQGQAVHSGNVLVTPNGDGNPYGDAAGSPYNHPSNCPPSSDYSTSDGSAPADPQGSQSDRACPPQGAPGASAVTGPYIGLGFDTNYQPGSGAPTRAPSVTPTYGTGTPDTTALDLILTGGRFYNAADDNLDGGEHDGVDGQYGTGQSYNGPSDGGSVIVQWQPLGGAQSMAGWTSLLEAAAAGGSVRGLAPVLQNPVPVAGAGGNICQDGICYGAYTSQSTVYQGGGGTGSQRDAYNYAGKDWTPSGCNSGGTSNEQACTTQPGSNGTTPSCSPSTPGYSSGSGDTNADCGANYYRQQEAGNVTSEPGVMVFADPDPQASPALPLDPLPAAYVGTCGVVLGGGAVQFPALAPALSPVAGTNSAGQLVAADPTGC
ncbi:MAG TPA: hypothetical protein VMV14_08675 [Acidimicrobiales bacterium]|nr:hypothetical protein [Acidimicrobiales bacterium]